MTMKYGGGKMKKLFILIILISPINLYAEPKGYDFVNDMKCSKEIFKYKYKDVKILIKHHRTLRFYRTVAEFLSCVDDKYLIKIKNKIDKEEHKCTHLHYIVPSNTHPKKVEKLEQHHIDEFYALMRLGRDFDWHVYKWYK